MEELLKNTNQKNAIKRAISLMLQAQSQGLALTKKPEPDSRFIKEIVALSKKYNADIENDKILLGHISKLESLGVITEELYPAVAEILATIYKTTYQNRIN